MMSIRNVRMFVSFQGSACSNKIDDQNAHKTASTYAYCDFQRLEASIEKQKQHLDRLTTAVLFHFPW